MTSREKAKRMERLDVASRRKARRRKDEQARWLLFGIIMVVYCIILVFLAWRFLKYTDQCLVRYENSQSIYAMEEYFKDFKADIEKGKLPKDVDLSAYASDYYLIDWAETAFMDQVRGKKLTFEKAEDSYKTETPSYMIYADGEKLSKVTFEGYDGEVILGILTVLKWKVASVESYFNNTEGSAEASTAPIKERELSDYVFTVPAGYTVYVDDLALDENQLTGETVEVAEFQYAKEYVDLSGMQVYRLNQIGCPVNVSMTDIDGNPVDFVQEGNSYTAGYVYSDEMPEDLKNFAITAVRQWTLLMTRDNWFEGVAPYLIANSFYYDMAYRFATGVDITFMSPHTLKDPAFTDVSVTNYVKYTDTCFACHVTMNVQMTLTVTGQDATNAVSSTFLFVYYDDTDDGIDNPHWAIADMIADSKLD